METPRPTAPDLAVVVRLTLPPLPVGGSARSRRLLRLQAVDVREAAGLHARVLGRLR